ncbi:putative steryl acetyl hydrolase [Lachnellula suecica]|uniref:Putative steryl acetyl hydrolase n=1 Tax=Lachnellula suecica TaxID=602035 RepID=A0A8T9BWP8_9HELO|nr:putative steryl acetyl hydrolase [Lachnellula suecica]
MPVPTDKSASSSYRSQQATIASLSLLEKLDTIPALLTVDPTDTAYLAFCKSAKVEPKSEVLSDGTLAHWIGEPGAGRVVVNFHGGGYCFPAGKDMFAFMHALIKPIPDTACLFLSYDLAPGAPYPRQLQQASMLMNHILTTLSISPQNIILTGDSAGANLVLALLSHISHPHPGLGSVQIPKVEMEGKFRGAVLISPWVDFSTDDKSFQTNKLKDCLGADSGTQWSSAFLDSAPHDYYNEASTAPASWWADLQVENIFVVAGEEEVLVDGIRRFVGTLEKGMVEGDSGGKVEFLCVQGEYHDQPALDLMFGYGEGDEGVQAKAVKGWVRSKL